MRRFWHVYILPGHSKALLNTSIPSIVFDVSADDDPYPLGMVEVPLAIDTYLKVVFEIPLCDDLYAERIFRRA